jgi:putative transposase
MQVTRGYKTELDLNNEQIIACLKHASAVRWAYNWGRSRYEAEYQAGRKTPNAQSLHKELNTLKQTDLPEPPLALGHTVGVDLGIKTLATLSDASTIENPKALSSNLKKLKRLSRWHSRKQKGSKNRAKARRALACLHAHIAHIRVDTLHKATSWITAKTKPDQERPTCIVIEDLNVSGMLKNRKLARAIADVGFSEFRRQLEYKAKFAGSLVYTVSQWEPSSKTCSCCVWVDEHLTLSDRVFHCKECGYMADRDVNAAINLALAAAFWEYIGVP